MADIDQMQVDEQLRSEQQAPSERRRPPALIADRDQLLKREAEVELLTPQAYDSKYGSGKQDESCVLMLDGDSYKPKPLYYKTLKVPANTPRDEKSQERLRLFNEATQRAGVTSEKFTRQTHGPEIPADSKSYETPAGTRTQQTDYVNPVQAGQTLPDAMKSTGNTYVMTYPKLDPSLKDLSLDEGEANLGKGNLRLKTDQFEFATPSTLNERYKSPDAAYSAYNRINPKQRDTRDDVASEYVRMPDGKYEEGQVYKALVDAKVAGLNPKSADSLIFNSKSWALVQPKHSTFKANAADVASITQRLEDLGLQNGLNSVNKNAAPILTLKRGETSPSQLIPVSDFKTAKNKDILLKDTWMQNPSKSGAGYTGSYSNLQVMLEAGRYPTEQQAKQLKFPVGQESVTYNDKYERETSWKPPANFDRSKLAATVGAMANQLGAGVEKSNTLSPSSAQAKKLRIQLPERQSAGLDR